jgi:hypothetical protein
MKRRTSKKPRKPSAGLIERKFSGRKVVQFPLLAGRTVERVRLFTSKDDHCISINFQDKTLLSLHFDLGFTLNASLSDIKTGNVRAIREWPPIPSAP